MKKLMVFAVAAMLCQGAIYAQKAQQVAEKDVKVSYVRDFQKQVKNPTDVQWWRVDSLTYKATFLDEEKSRQAMVFNNKGTETYYFIERQYYPAAIKDTVAHLFPKYKVQDVWVRKTRGKMTYQAAINLQTGFLWWKKEKDAKTLNFEVDGKYINAK